VLIFYLLLPWQCLPPIGPLPLFGPPAPLSLSSSTSAQAIYFSRRKLGLLTLYPCLPWLGISFRRVVLAPHLRAVPPNPPHACDLVRPSLASGLCWTKLISVLQFQSGFPLSRPLSNEMLSHYQETWRSFPSLFFGLLPWFDSLSPLAFSYLPGPEPQHVTRSYHHFLFLPALVFLFFF